MWVGGRDYFLVCFLDEYTAGTSCITSCCGAWTERAVSVAAQAALETLPRDEEGKLLERPEIRSDNGSCYISREFGAVLDEHELSHRRIKPHCPEENGLMERANRTIDEALEGEDLADYLQAVKVIAKTHPMVQRGAFAQCLGVPSASRLLSREARGDVRRAAAEAGRGPAPTQREEPTTAAAYAAINQRGDCCLTQPGFCAKSVETKHSQLT